MSQAVHQKSADTSQKKWGFMVENTHDVMQAMNKAEEDIRAGEIISHAEVSKMFKS
ncbi:hypothetical protein HON22_03305 [Candidatus Peregrinibacteria bacterium]|jgi:hypothetical protein|nr:hypothetical protein [Candidatus Peregrinibacteria bacterium]